MHWVLPSSPGFQLTFHLAPFSPSLRVGNRYSSSSRYALILQKVLPSHRFNHTRALHLVPECPCCSCCLSSFTFFAERRLLGVGGAGYQPRSLFFWGRLLITYLCDDCLFGVGSGREASASAINNAICTSCGSSKLFAKWKLNSIFRAQRHINGVPSCPTLTCAPFAISFSSTILA